MLPFVESLVRQITLTTLLDISITALFIYWLFSLIRGTRAVTLVIGVSILLGIWGDIGSLGLAILLIITAVMMHAFWKETDPMTKQMEMVAFNKDIALAGAALILWVFFHYNAVPWTITDPLFGYSY